MSRTFHGRDIFAPVAAHLAGGRAAVAHGGGRSTTTCKPDFVKPHPRRQAHLERPDPEDRPLRQHRHQLPRGRLRRSGDAQFQPVAGAEGGRRGRAPTRVRGRHAAARGPDRGQGHRGRRRRGHDARHRCGGRARAGGLRDREEAARRGRDRDRQDQPPRACVRDVHRVAHMGNHPQSVGRHPRPRADPPAAAGPRWRRDWPRRRRRRTAPAPSASPPPTAGSSA